MKTFLLECGFEYLLGVGVGFGGGGGAGVRRGEGYNPACND